MNILLINHYAGVAEMEHRPRYLAREWIRQGHRVTIVAASFSHLRLRNPCVRGGILREEIDGIDYAWIKTPRYGGNGVGRAVNIVTFAGRLLCRTQALAKQLRPNVVVASSTHPLDIYPAWVIARRARARLVFEVHDLWPQTPIELGGISPRHPFVLLMRAAEKFAYRRAERVVSILPMAAKYMEAHGMAAEKFLHVPNGIDTSEWNCATELPEEHAKLFQRLKEKGLFVVAYAGAHGVANALGTVIDAAQRLAADPVAFVLVGQGPVKPQLERAVAERKLANVYFLPSVPKSTMPALLAAPDALYIGLKSSPLFRFGISPNKLIDYLMAAKPVIQAIRAGNDLVADSGCGLSLPPEDPESLANGVRRLIAIDPSERSAMGERGKAYALEHHDYRVLAHRFFGAFR